MQTSLCHSADRNQAPISGQPQPNPQSEGLSSATPTWPQPPNPAPPRPAPTPAAGQPVGPEMNQTQGAQRTLAWTGHLEWQDTVSVKSGELLV